MTPDKDIVTAEVVDVPKPERPDLWMGIKRSGICGNWMAGLLFESRERAEGYYGNEARCLVRIPGSTPQPQPAAPYADAVEDLMRAIQEFDGWLESSWDEEYGHRLYAMEDCSVLLAEATASTYQAAAAACLAKIRGAR